MGRKSVENQLSNLSKALKGKEEFKFETLNHTKNGEEYWVNFSMIPITNKRRRTFALDFHTKRYYGGKKEKKKRNN